MRQLKRNSEVKEEKQVKEAVSPSSIGRSKEICDWAIEYIEDTLPEWEGQSVYGADLGAELTEGPNVDGAYIIGRQKAMDFIRDHFNDAADEYEYEKDNFGEVLHNPFENPEAFVVCMLINTVEGLLGQVPVVEEHWNEELELTKEVIDEILKALK